MRNECNTCERRMAEVLFGTLRAGEEERLAEHLAACPACTQAFREMQGALHLAARRARPEPSPAFWDGYTDRLLARMEAEETPAVRPSFLVAWWAGLVAWLHGQPVWARQLAVAVVLVAVGIAIGRFAFQQDAAAPPVAVQETGPLPLPPEAFVPAEQVALEERTRHYLDRSKVLLLGLVNFDDTQDDPSLLNLPRRQAVARELVQEADSLKLQLHARDQRRLSELVSDLEVILLQIANLEAEHDVPAVELVRSGVDRRALLLKINLAQMRMDAPRSSPEQARDTDMPQSL